jgi:ElaB/YqjD/DUF883 family membrane-anchored ribosome-binding protein
MQTLNPFDKTDSLADKAANSVDHAIKSTQRVANEALDGLASGVEHLRDQAAPLLNGASDGVKDFAQHGMDKLRADAQYVQNQAVHMRDEASDYIKNDPLKAMLIAAATGAAIMAIYSMFSRAR